MLGGPFEARPRGEGASGTPPPLPHPAGFISGDTLWGQLLDTAGTMYGNVESSQAGQGQMWVLRPGGGEGREHPGVLVGVGASPAVLLSLTHTPCHFWGLTVLGESPVSVPGARGGFQGWVVAPKGGSLTPGV